MTVYSVIGVHHCETPSQIGITPDWPYRFVNWQPKAVTASSRWWLFLLTDRCGRGAAGSRPGGLFLVRQALARHDWGFEGLRAEREGCAAGTATHSSKLRMERNWQSQSFLSDHRTCGHFPPTEWCWGFEGPARKGQRRRAIILRAVALRFSGHSEKPRPGRRRLSARTDECTVGHRALYLKLTPAT